MKTHGVLLGAFEIPLLPGVLIDIWEETITDSSSQSQGNGASSQQKAQSQLDFQPRHWATTPVDGIGFAVLERVFIKTTSPYSVSPSPTADGSTSAGDGGGGAVEGEGTLSNIVEASIFGRHPAKGHLLLESINSDS